MKKVRMILLISDEFVDEVREHISELWDGEVIIEDEKIVEIGDMN